MLRIASGSHSHKFKPLVEKLGIFTLIITDIDPVKATGYHKKAVPKRGANLITGNSSIKEWCGIDSDFDKLLDLPDADKELKNGTVRIAYQLPLCITLNGNAGQALSATFEDFFGLC